MPCKLVHCLLVCDDSAEEMDGEDGEMVVGFRVKKTPVPEEAKEKSE